MARPGDAIVVWRRLERQQLDHPGKRAFNQPRDLGRRPARSGVLARLASL
jgi:hypothetical protein